MYFMYVSLFLFHDRLITTWSILVLLVAEMCSELTWGSDSHIDIVTAFSSVFMFSCF